MRDSKVPVPDIVIMLRRNADHIDAGLNAPDHAGEQAALGNTH